MFKLIGINEIFGNLVGLTRSYSNGIANKLTLQKAYRKFLRKVQPNVPKPESIDIAYLWKKKDIALLLKVFKEESILDDFKEVFDNISNLNPHLPINRIKFAL